MVSLDDIVHATGSIILDMLGNDVTGVQSIVALAMTGAFGSVAVTRARLRDHWRHLEPDDPDTTSTTLTALRRAASAAGMPVKGTRGELCARLKPLATAGVPPRLYRRVQTGLQERRERRATMIAKAATDEFDRLPFSFDTYASMTTLTRTPYRLSERLIFSMPCVEKTMRFGGRSVITSWFRIARAADVAMALLPRTSAARRDLLDLRRAAVTIEIAAVESMHRQNVAETQRHAALCEAIRDTVAPPFPRAVAETKRLSRRVCAFIETGTGDVSTIVKPFVTEARRHQERCALAAWFRRLGFHECRAESSWIATASAVAACLTEVPPDAPPCILRARRRWHALVSRDPDLEPVTWETHGQRPVTCRYLLGRETRDTAVRAIRERHWWMSRAGVDANDAIEGRTRPLADRVRAAMIGDPGDPEMPACVRAVRERCDALMAVTGITAVPIPEATCSTLWNYLEGRADQGAAAAIQFHVWWSAICGTPYRERVVGDEDVVRHALCSGVDPETMPPRIRERCEDVSFLLRQLCYAVDGYIVCATSPSLSETVKAAVERVYRSSGPEAVVSCNHGVSCVRCKRRNMQRRKDKRRHAQSCPRDQVDVDALHRFLHTSDRPTCSLAAERLAYQFLTRPRHVES